MLTLNVSSNQTGTCEKLNLGIEPLTMEIHLKCGVPRRVRQMNDLIRSIEGKLLETCLVASPQKGPLSITSPIFDQPGLSYRFCSINRNTMTAFESKKNLAVYTNPSHDLRVVETEIPEPKDDEVIVHVKATGICGRFALVEAAFSDQTVMFISGNMDVLGRQWWSAQTMASVMKVPGW